MKGTLIVLTLLLGTPASEREQAQRSLEAARNAVAQADPAGERREAAATRLEEAEALFRSAKYTDAGKAADGARNLVLASAPAPSQSFTVEVSDTATTVTGRTGKPVSVTAEGVTREVAPGESVRVEKGQPPPPPSPPAVPLTAPKPTEPGNNKKLVFQPVKGRLGPVMLAWSAVTGAREYEVEVVPIPSGTPLRMMVNTARAQLPSLPPGRYRWTVRAVGQDARSEASAARHFELVDGSLKLEVENSEWK